jgi:enoyl-CoA hydratase/carnithine racemase
LTGETITAREALEYGLLNTVRTYYLSWNVD